MKKFMLLFALVIGFHCYGQNLLKIESELQDELQLKSDGDLIKISIIMEAQYDQFVLRSKANNYRAKEAKRTFVVNELKYFAQESQREVMSFLNHFVQNNSVSNVTSFWIFNGITCSATREVIEELSYMDGVLIIGFDREHTCIFEDANPRSTDPTREITYNVLKVNANLVWDELGYTGEGVIVGIIDTGVNYNHNDLKTHMWDGGPDYPNHGWNFSGNNNNPIDDHSHGTHCAGTVAGDGTSGSQTGMAPDATIMAIKVWNSGGSGSATQMCSGFQFGVEHGAHVLSMSGGVGGGGSESERIQFRNTMVNVLEAGVIASIAAGNEHSGWYYQAVPNQVRVPGNCPPPWLHPDQTTTGGTSSVICVGATDQNDNIASFSSWGPVTWQSIPGYNDYPYNPGMGLIRPDVCAPGVNIKSCTHNNNSGYTLMDGTSMACPCVSGVLALMLSKKIDLTPAEICEILETTALHLSSTKSNTFGSGRINAYDAVNTISTCEGISNLDYSLVYDKTANLTWDRPEDDVNLLGYKLYVDKVVIEELIEEESYSFKAQEEGIFEFCVAAVHQSEDGDCISSKACADIEIISICDSITNLMASVDSVVTLTWSPPELISEVLQYNVFRDNILVGSVETETFSDEVSPGFYNYSVAVEYINECISNLVSIDVVALLCPKNLTAEPQQDVIELSWEYDSDIILFCVYRDDKMIVENITKTNYTDTEVSTDTEYCYVVKAFDGSMYSTPSNEACTIIVGIEEYSKHLKIYPNPSNTTVYVEEALVEKVTIYNSIGQIVKVVPATTPVISIDVSHFTSGNYVFQLTYLDGSSKTAKIIVQ
jgi:hypothetical protein